MRQRPQRLRGLEAGRFGRRAARVALLVVVSLMASGCFYSVTAVRSTVPRGRTESAWRNTWVFGLLGRAELDARELCDGDVAALRVDSTLLTLGATALTLGVWTPRRVSVTCGANGAR
jgi:hypothetical protein